MDKKSGFDVDEAVISVMSLAVVGIIGQSEISYVCGRCTGVQEVHRRYAEGAQNLHGRCTGGALKVHGRFMKGAWKICGRCMGGVQKVCRRLHVDFKRW